MPLFFYHSGIYLLAKHRRHQILPGLVRDGDIEFQGIVHPRFSKARSVLIDLKSIYCLKDDVNPNNTKQDNGNHDYYCRHLFKAIFFVIVYSTVFFVWDHYIGILCLQRYIFF